MKFRSCFVSDFHIGSTKAQVDSIYDFLKQNEFENLYLVGDIIDIWKMNSSGFINKSESQKHVNVIQRILKLSKKGTNIYYIYGNHDEFVEKLFHDNPIQFGNITFTDKIEYNTLLGKKYIIMHGHQFDLVSKYNPWLFKIGDTGYHFMIFINKYYNKIRNLLGLNYHSISMYMKIKVKKIINFINKYSNLVSNYAFNHNYDGIITGHIHHPENKMINGIHYLNCGCWTDKLNCSYIIENENGEFKILKWNK